MYLIYVLIFRWVIAVIAVVKERKIPVFKSCFRTIFAESMPYCPCFLLTSNENMGWNPTVVFYYMLGVLPHCSTPTPRSSENRVEQTGGENCLYSKAQQRSSHVALNPRLPLQGARCLSCIFMTKQIDSGDRLFVGECSDVNAVEHNPHCPS